MDNENKEIKEYYYEHKSHWLKTLALILATLIGAFLAFYFVADITLSRLTDPAYQMRKIEKFMQKEQKRMDKLEKNFFDRPFEPKMAPMLVNLVKENDEYKLIVDLKPLDNDDKGIDMKIKDNIVTISGEIERKEHQKEEIMNFSQSYYLDEKIKTDNVTREKKGNKLIITIPFED